MGRDINQFDYISELKTEIKQLKEVIEELIKLADDNIDAQGARFILDKIAQKAQKDLEAK